MVSLDTLWEKCIEIAEVERNGTYKIRDNYYCYVEHWESICVEEECAEYTDEEEFDDCAYSYAEHMTFEVIPKELMDEFEILKVAYVDLGVAAYGTTVILLKKK